MKADLSIIVTNFNKPPEQLDECMQSIKDQTVAPKEVILVDDGSEKQRAHPFATSIILPHNKGVGFARDIGVRLSTGKLLLFVDADDKLAPDFIQQCGKLIAKKDIVYTSRILFGNIEQNVLIEAPEEIKPEDIIGKRCDLLVTSMMHRTVYEKLEGFRELPVFEDWDFWIRAMFNGYTFGKANTLLWYRQNRDSRNKLSKEEKSVIHNKITAPYEVVKGRLVERKHG